MEWGVPGCHESELASWSQTYSSNVERESLLGSSEQTKCSSLNVLSRRGSFAAVRRLGFGVGCYPLVRSCSSQPAPSTFPVPHRSAEEAHRRETTIERGGTASSSRCSSLEATLPHDQTVHARSRPLTRQEWTPLPCRAKERPALEALAVRLRLRHSEARRQSRRSWHSAHPRTRPEPCDRFLSPSLRSGRLLSIRIPSTFGIARTTRARAG